MNARTAGGFVTDGKKGENKQMPNTKKILKKENIRFFIIGVISAIIIFFLFGIPTDVIPNKLYTRMIPSTSLDLFFLSIISLMLGTYTGLFFYLRYKKKKQSNAAAYAGTGGSFLAISCPICISLLVWVFGAAVLMAYLEPLRPYIGFLSIGLIGFGLYGQIKIIKKRKTCG